MSIANNKLTHNDTVTNKLLELEVQHYKNLRNARKDYINSQLSKCDPSDVCRSMWRVIAAETGRAAGGPGGALDVLVSGAPGVDAAERARAAAAALYRFYIEANTNTGSSADPALAMSYQSKFLGQTTAILDDHEAYSLGGVWSLRNLSISVPRAVLSGEGQAAVLRCSYDLEGAALYSIRWYRAETEFYRYVPRELPPTMVFPLPGASVDLTQSDHQQVRVVNLNRRLSGLYQCEVSADAPLFHTDIASAPLTVVDPPFRAPRLHVSRGSYSRGDVIRANCSVDEAYPAPNITWLIDDVKIAESVSWQTSELDFKERATLSRLELSILETERYQVGLTYTSASLAGVYQHNHVYEYDREANSEERDTLRYTLSPPSSGQFTLSCVATIFDIYARGSEPAAVREDAPRPASVTGEDSAGVPTSASVVVVTWCAAVALTSQLPL